MTELCARAAGKQVSCACGPAAGEQVEVAQVAVVQVRVSGSIVERVGSRGQASRERASNSKWQAGELSELRMSELYAAACHRYPLHTSYTSA